MLEHKDVAHYLLRRGLITPQVIAEGDLAVFDVMRRNNNFKVVSKRGPSYLLKQGVGAGRAATVAHEAEVYKLLHARAGSREIGNFVPGVRLYDPGERILVLELLPRAENLQEYHLRLGRFPATVGSRLGEALSALHRTFSSSSYTYTSRDVAAGIQPDATTRAAGGERAEEAASIKQDPAWALSVHRPDMETYLEISSANIKLIKIIQQFPEFGALLDRLRGEWRAETLIHGDLKWGNCVVHSDGEDPGGSGPATRQRKRLKLVDWELATTGDPCWDIGSVFSDYLSFWLLSIPITGTDPPERFLELARYPLSKMQPAIRQFWLSYVQSMGLDVATSCRWLVRSIQYAAARLIQAAFEQGQASAQITGNTVCSLQLSLNILQRPHEGAIHLLGISPWPGEAA